MKICFLNTGYVWFFLIFWKGWDWRWCGIHGTD